jgi:epoxyqueuosine reductase
MSDGRQDELRRRLLALGFDEVRFADANASPASENLRAWIDAGMHADMAWMERTAEKRLDPQQVLSGTKSVIVLGVSYWRDERRDENASANRDAESGPRWARYATYLDYHDTMKPALVAAGRTLEELFGIRNEDYRYYVDTGPVLERSWAARAGIGFVGKNAMLISREHGNWLFLAAILTRVPFVADEPIRKTISGGSRAGGVGLLCGKCERCLTACPTNAFAAPGVVDARRCISYQTIENKGIIPRELREGIGERIYGCDVCLEVCPWNRFAQQGRQMLLTARDEITRLSLRELLELTSARFAEVFRGTPIKRLKLAGLLRNACVVAGNSGDSSLLPQLTVLARHELAIVRAHAVWSIARLGGRSILAELRGNETDPRVLAEFET